MLIFLLSPPIGEIILFSCNFCPPSTSMLGLLCLVYLSGLGTGGLGVQSEIVWVPHFHPDLRVSGCWDFFSSVSYQTGTGQALGRLSSNPMTPLRRQAAL